MYKFSRNYHDWAFDNRDKVKPSVSALYFYILDLANRLGWREYFSVTAKECMEAIGVSSYKTYKSSFDVLCENNLIKIVKASKNQYQANIISLVEPAENQVGEEMENTCNGSALVNFTKASPKQVQSKSHIHNTINTHNNINTIRDSKDKPNRFVKPSVEDIKSFCSEIGASVDAEKFFYYYESSGWKVGKNPMKDWKAAVRGWNRRAAESNNANIGLVLENNDDVDKYKNDTIKPW